MRLGDAAAVRMAEDLRDAVPAGVEVVVCPSFTALARVADVLRDSSVIVGAQDCGPDARGAYTGAVSADDLVTIGCREVIVGHSERRALGEGDAVITRKLHAALAAGLHPILCVGERADERGRGVREEVIRRQLGATLTGLALVEPQALRIAYEPVWAIGSGRAATPEDAAGAYAVIRDCVGEFAGESTLARTKVLYGGSVDAENVRAFLADPSAAGVLVGTASADATQFRALLTASPR